MSATDGFAADSPPFDNAAPAQGRWARFDSLVERWGERLNPILVKESRQALKSKQFSITFALVLAFGWIWSMLGVALIGPDIYRGNFGGTMFVGYFIVLAFPLLVIVPFTAFRSLASEREDGTFELLSVSTLRPRQVIGGKLGTSLLQMMVYLSAMAPCLAFTYFLRGIDFVTILWVIGWTFTASVALSIFGLLLATATQARHWQVVLSVFFVFGLGFVFFIAIGLAMQVTQQSMPFQIREFWIANAAFLTAVVGYSLLAWCIAAAQLTFVSENRSTRVRAVMLSHQALLVGWMAYLFAEWPEEEFVLVFLVLLGIHWYAMGAFMTGEWPQLSARVKRGLPQTLLGRVFFTWFNPGPGTGYVFALANLAAGAVVGFGALYAWWRFVPKANWRTDPETMVAFGVVLLSYVTIYLGLGKLLTAVLRRFFPVGMLLCVLLHLVLALAGAIIPFVPQAMSPHYRDDYTLFQITNWVSTLLFVAEEQTTDLQLIVLLVALPVSALLVFLANLPGIVREVRHERVASPRRVAEEDAQIEAVLHPQEPVRSSPWD